MMPLSEACERNKGPILEVLRDALAGAHRVLEIGCGTGQHAVHFARHLPHLHWRPTELPEQLPIAAERIRAEGSSNLAAPVELDVRRLPWPVAACDGLFTANTLHIMHWDGVEAFFAGAGAALGPEADLCVYGPFRYSGRHTSPSNAAFDQYLKTRDPGSGIRAFEAVDALARAQGFVLVEDHAMPANNRTLHWRRGPERA